MECQDCGTSLPGGATICSECGSPVAADSVEAVWDADPADQEDMQSTAIHMKALGAEDIAAMRAAAEQAKAEGKSKWKFWKK